MNPWDVATWVAAVLLAGSALVIFGYFVRDASSLLNRDMHGADEEPEDASSSGLADGGSQPPDGLPR